MAFGIGQRTPSSTRTLALIWGALAALTLGASASGDAFVDKANAAAAATPGTKPAQDVLMPALAKMAPMPKSPEWENGEYLGLLLAVPGDKVWKDLEPWATAEPQQAALKALETITTGKDRYILGIGYGQDAVPKEWADAGLYIGLNKDGLLYSANYRYLDRLSDLVGLAMFESARAASTGDGERAIALCTQVIQLGRILVERASLHETQAGVLLIHIALERLRDVLYQYESAFNADKLREAAKKLSELRIREIPLPIVNKLAADQIVARTFKEKGGVEGPVLAEVMSGAKSQTRPLTRFSEAAFWADHASGQADWLDTTTKVKGVWADWEKRWKLPDLYDPVFDIPSDFKQMNAEKYLAVYYPLLGIDELFDARKRLLVQIDGTINSIGVVGFHIKQKTLPPLLVSTEPKFVDKLQADIFALDRRQLQRTYLPFQYWVPIRDQKFDKREQPHPYEITVTMINGGGGLVATKGGIAAEMVEAFSPGFVREWVASAPAGVIDSDAMKVDATALREYLQKMADDHKWTPQERKALTQFFKAGAASGLNAESFDAKYDAWFMANGEKMRTDAAAHGIDASEITALVKDSVRTLLGVEAIQRALQSANGSDTIEESNAKQILKAFLDVVAQPIVLDKLMDIATRYQQRAKEAIAAAGGEGLPTTVFKAEVDDKQFLLYSVGPNGIDDRARLVGPGGIDILMWPPILSLQRQAQAAHNAGK